MIPQFRDTAPPEGGFADPGAAIYIRLLLLAILTLGFAARAVTYRSPLFDFHSWRQADTATIARNFATERFNPLYPQVDSRGAHTHGYVLTGLELYAFMVAAVSKVAGFSPALGRLLNTLLFPVAALLLWRFVHFRYGAATALTAVFIYAVGLPLTLFIDRAFMNESLLTLLAIACLWSAQSYCASGRAAPLVVLLVASALIAMVKPTYLVVCAPIAGLFIERFGWKAFARWELWGTAAVILISGAAWFSHVRGLAQSTGLSFGLTDKLIDPDLLFSAEYPFKVAVRLVKDVLGPVVVIFVPVGTVLAVRRGKYAEVFGLLAFAAYLIVVTAGNFHHNYYQLPIVPIATVLASVGIIGAMSRLATRRGWDRARTLAAYSLILWAAAASTFVRSVSAHNWYEVDSRRLRLCDDLTAVLGPTDRLVFVNENSPDVLFCANRKGWLLQPAESNAAHIRHLAASGASVVIVSKANEHMVPELRTSAERLTETPDYLVFRMAAPGTVASEGRR